jgi:flagellar motility protein MotE (MotC chaperone)
MACSMGGRTGALRKGWLWGVGSVAVAGGLLGWMFLWPMGRASGQSQGEAGTALRVPANPEGSVALSIQMMEEVRRRESALATREEDVQKREERLRALEQALSQGAKGLEKREQEVKAAEGRARGQVQEEESRRIQQLAKLIEAGSPEQGGKLLSDMDPRIAALVLSRMNARKAGRFLGNMDPQKAVVISDAIVKPQH